MASLFLRAAPSLLVLTAGLGHAQAPVTLRAERSLHIARATKPPNLEDYVNGGDAASAARITDFRQFDPNDGNSASLATSAWLSYDDENIYIIFVCRAEAADLRARFSKRDDIFADDGVGIYLDTFHDRQHAYEFLVNPFGIQGDGINTEGQGDDWRFDTYWTSEGRFTADGYAIRMVIPFKSLRFTNKDMQTWGIALARFIPSRNETSFWPYITHRVQGFVPQFSEADGFDSLAPGRNIRLIPYGVFQSSRNLETPTGVPPSYRTDDDVRAGFDVKLAVHQSLTLDATVNPDFSQVESDDPQVTVNQRYEVFFPEKRPFFLENASYFQTPEDLFFSRRIVDPSAGVRLTGRLNEWSIGVLAASDRGPGDNLDPADPNYGDVAAIGVVRIQRDIFNQSTIGGFASTWDLGSSHNRVASLDTRLKLFPNWVFTGQAIASESSYLDGTHSAGPAYLARLDRTGLRWNYTALYLDRSPGFHADVGYVPRSDIRESDQHWNYYWRPETGPISSFGPFVDGSGNWNRAGRVQDAYSNEGFQIQFRRATYFSVNYSRAFELFQNIGFHKEITGFFLNSDRYKRVGLQAYFGFGTGVNYSPPDGILPILAKTEYGNTHLTFRPTVRLRVQQAYFYTRLASVFTNHILRSMVQYQFTRSLSVRTIADYNAVLTNSTAVNYDRTKAFTGDILFAYLPYAGTAVYLGYTNHRENLALIGEDVPTTVRTNSPNIQTGSQVFVKMSYLFRF